MNIEASHVKTAPIWNWHGHTLRHGSVLDTGVADLWAATGIDILYSDPPWGNGNMRYWQTMAGKMDGVPPQQSTYEALLGALLEFAVPAVREHCFIETGLRWADVVAYRLSDATGTPARQFRVRYRSGSRLLDNVLVHAPKKGAQRTFDLDPTGLEGLALPRECIKAVRVAGGIVADPCCGTGIVAVAAIMNGMTFVGNDFNRTRLGQCEARIRKALK